MDKYSNKILKYLNKNSSREHGLTLSKLASNLEINEYIVKEVLDSLENKNLIDYVVIPGKIDILITDLAYFSTIHGKDYFRQCNLNWLKSILNGLIFPIIVAFFTALITALTVSK